MLLAYLRQALKTTFYKNDKEKMNRVYLSKPVDLLYEIAVMQKYVEIVEHLREVRQKETTLE